MARKTPAEYQREYRERVAKAREAKGDQTEPFLRRPFFEFMQTVDNDNSDWSTLDVYAAHSGIEFDYPTDDTDVDFQKITDLGEVGGFSPGDLGKHGNSLAKAERMMATFAVGHRVLANLINQYKREELQARIAELEASDLTDPTLRKAALADLVKLNRLLERLRKEERFTYPAVEIKG